MAILRKGDEFIRVMPVPEGKRYPPGTKKKDRDQYRLVTFPGGKEKMMKYPDLVAQGYQVWSV